MLLILPNEILLFLLFNLFLQLKFNFFIRFQEIAHNILKCKSDKTEISVLSLHKKINFFNECNYFTVTVAPASSNSFLSFSASSFEMPSLTVFGAPSTKSFASFKPNPV